MRNDRRQVEWPAARKHALGALLLTVGLVAAATIAPQAWVVLPLGLALVAAVLWAPGSLRRLLRWRILVFVAVLLLSSALWWNGQERLLGGVFSRGGLLAGLWMSARALAILVSIGILTTTVSVGQFTDVLRRSRWREQGFVLGVAVNMLPLVQETLGNTLTALRLRGGFRHRRWRALQLLATSVITNLLRYADDIVCSAEARALGIWWRDRER